MSAPTHPSVSTPLVAPVRYVASLENAPVAEESDETSDKTGAKTIVESAQAHAESHGLLIGELTVCGNLPPEYAQGLFADAAKYHVVLRFSTIRGDRPEGSVASPRGLSVKVIGVRGPRAEGDESDGTQDFVLVNSPVFQAPSAKEFAGSPGRNAETHILGETFYSVTPLLHGEYVAKIGVFPVSQNLTALTGTRLPNSGESGTPRSLVVEFFLQNSARWEIRAQLCTNPETMPIEDPAVRWPEDESPYVTVGSIAVGPQDAWYLEKIEAIEAGLTFSPWHALAAHRPLGAINRARRQAYQASAEFRAARRHAEIAEPKTLAEVTGG